MDIYPDCIWLDGQNRLIAPCAQYYIGWCYENIEDWNKTVLGAMVVLSLNMLSIVLIG